MEDIKSPLSYEIMSNIYSPMSSKKKAIYLLRKLLFLFRSLLFQKSLYTEAAIVSGSYYHNTHFSISPPWSLRCKFRFPIKLILVYLYTDILIVFSSVKKLKNIEQKLFQKTVQNTVESISNFNLKEVILAHDMTFSEKVFIEAARRLKVRTKIELHGLPARYNSFDDNYADELVVWGEAIKSNYVHAGVDPLKISVKNLKHYRPFKSLLELKLNDLNTMRVLIVTKSENIIPHSTGYRLRNPFMPIDYIEQILDVLDSLFVSSTVSIKPHPSEHISIYERVFDPKEFNIVSEIIWEDYDMLIGPSSTMLLDSLNMEKPYLLYEPLSAQGLDLQGNGLVPPFSGIDGLVAAYTREHLKELLLNNKLTWRNAWVNDYVA